MKVRIVSNLLLLGILAIGITAMAADKTAPSASSRFEALKALAGDWVELSADGKPTNKLLSSIRLTSGGTALQETIFPGTDHEMVTMYHVDGSELVLTHYCMLGNQPRMRADAGAEPNRFAFKFIGATNLKSPQEQHMNEATLTILGPDRFQSEWVSCQDGKTCHQVKFDLARKTK
jgi:hypothetical protein